MFSIEGSAESVASPLTPDLLKHFAFEAESVGDYDLAEHYHKEVRQWVSNIEPDTRDYSPVVTD